jgi:hypothetical protein
MERLSLSKHQWKEIVSQWQNSGQTMSNFCKNAEINKTSLGYWVIKFRNEEDAISSGFIKLPIEKANNPEVPNCELIFTDGTRMLFYQKPDYMELKQLFS